MAWRRISYGLLVSTLMACDGGGKGGTGAAGTSGGGGTTGSAGSSGNAGTSGSAGMAACRPSQQFFVDEIWPNVLAKDYGGTHCYDSSCHGVLAPNALDLLVQDPMPAGTVPLTGVWATNYMAAIEEMNCSNPSASRLLELPSGTKVHGGGKFFEPDGPEADLIKMWVTQP